MRASVLVTVGTVVLLGVPGRVAAGGLEYTGAGTQAVARGGAVTARAEDPMVLSYNPAGLAELRGNQVMIGGNLALMKACVDPIGYYGWGAYGGGHPTQFVDTKTNERLLLNLGTAMASNPAEQAYYNGRLDTVCMKEGLTPVPQFGITSRISEDLGVGFGLMFPSATPQGQWGGENGVIHGADGLRPAPTRYMMLRSGTIGLFPTVGIGYRLAKWFRIGASFEWGIINVDNLSMAVVSGGTSPSSDIVNRVRATDWFIPAFNASVHIVPTDAIDIVAAFRYQGDLNAPGTIALTTGLFDPNSVGRTTTDQVTSVHQRFPWKLRGGIRYGSRLAPRPSGTGHDEAAGVNGARIHDAFEDERWDVEADVEYQLNARNQTLTINYLPNQAIQSQSASGAINAATFPDASQPYTAIDKRWRNQVSVRVGGSYNVIPGRLGFSIGAHYENLGVDPSYMQLDYWPLARLGLHAGVKVRIARTIDLIAAYSHIFQETLVVGAPDGAPGDKIYTNYAMTHQVTQIDKSVGAPTARGQILDQKMENPVPAAPDGQARLTQNLTKTQSGQPPWIINSGTYRSSIDVVSLAVNVHF
jgi:long-subunit fatty acid transport protein